jgi:hypothetical protein
MHCLRELIEMLEIEFVLQELQKFHAKEKSLRARNQLEQAMNALKEYNRLKKEF